MMKYNDRIGIIILKMKCIIPRGSLILTNFIKNGYHTTATATCIHYGRVANLKRRKIMMLFCDDGAAAVWPACDRFTI